MLCKRGLQSRRARWGVGGMLVAALILTGCSQGTGIPSASNPTSGQALRTSSSPPSGRARSTFRRVGQRPRARSGRTRRNRMDCNLNILAGLDHDEPIYDGDFADPSALAVSNTLYFYASSSSPSTYDHGANVPVIALSRGDGFSGRFLGDALPKVPSWTVSGYQWGPDVWERPDGTYVLYYSTPATVPLGCLASPPAHGCVKTTHGETNAECISRATATTPTGPFVDNSTSAFICPLDEGGAIDPSVFVASDGTPWLLWKSDGDCCDESTSIYTQQLSSDGLSTAGPPHRLLGATQPWEDKLVEAPTMIQDGNHYWLFYSGSLWGHKTYGIGIASCESVTGPCTKPLDHAWVSSDADGVSDQGPGGEEFYETGSIVWMVHHGLAPGQTGNSAQRRLYVDLVAFPPGSSRTSPPGSRRRRWPRRRSTTETLLSRRTPRRHTSRCCTWRACRRPRVTQRSSQPGRRPAPTSPTRRATRTSSRRSRHANSRCTSPPWRSSWRLSTSALAHPRGHDNHGRCSEPVGPDELSTLHCPGVLAAHSFGTADPWPRKGVTSRPDPGSGRARLGTAWHAWHGPFQARVSPSAAPLHLVDQRLLNRGFQE